MWMFWSSSWSSDRKPCSAAGCEQQQAVESSGWPRDKMERNGRWMGLMAKRQDGAEWSLDGLE